MAAKNPEPRSTKLIDMTELLTEKGVEALKAGIVINLSTDPENPQEIKAGNVFKMKMPLSQKFTNLKIVRLDRKRGKIWCKEIELVDAETAEQIAYEEEQKAAKLNRTQKRWLAKRNRRKA